jgi:hypothetical protein
MIRLVKDRFGGDATLIDAVNKLTVSSQEAVAIIGDTSTTVQPNEDQLASLEAIVAFDGTRPSFLVKDNQIDFQSSYNNGRWKDDLAPYLARLATFTACVGRVELGETHIGTAFLVTPTIALTNRHVAQAIARFQNGKIKVKSGVFLDFGREEWNGRQPFDRRTVEQVLFAGKDPIEAPIDHRKFDLAALRISGSELEESVGQRHLSIGGVKGDDFDDAKFVAAIGYPARPQDFVPLGLQTQYAQVLNRLLEGDGGAKRFAPGSPTGLLTDVGTVSWTATHDATTVNGNSGSPLLVIANEPGVLPLRACGLHYGGNWGGERTNWAHLLALTTTAVGYGESVTFSDFCMIEGIDI